MAFMIVIAFFVLALGFASAALPFVAAPRRKRLSR